MREKLLWSSVVLLGLMLVVSYAQSPARPEFQIGRFQIVVSPPGAGEQAQIFRLDTVTGKTSVKALTPDNILAWSAIIPDGTSLAREVK
jgi:hypothetical protein